MPAAAPTIALLGLRTISPPFRVVGIDVWLDPTFLVGGYTATVDALGTARLGLPIPAGIRPAGSVAFQLVPVDACGPQGLTASNAVGFGIIP